MSAENPERRIKPNHFYTLATAHGEIMLGSESPIVDFPAVVDATADEVGHNLFDIADALRKFGLRRIQAANYYNLDTGSKEAPDDT
jgi:hypothetical protein